MASTGGGDITVHQDQARSDKAQLIGTVQYSLIRPRLTINGDGLHLDCRFPTGNCGLSATVDVPLNIAAVNLASEGGNMQVNGIDSDLTLNSGGGDVTVSGVGGIVNASTGGGNVTVSDLTRTLQFATDGGDVNGNGLSSLRSPPSPAAGTSPWRSPARREPEHHQRRGDITIVLPHGSTRYAITYNTDGGDYSAPVPVSSSSGHAINVQSGGGNISIAES